jgi:hypothetical protein
MVMSFAVSAGGSTVPVGMYKAIFAGVEDTPPHAEYGRGVRFKFKVVGGEHDAEEATVICGIEKPASPKNRLGRVLGGIVGKPVAIGETITVDQYIGKTYLIQVEQAPGGNGSTRVGTIMPQFS